MSLITSAQANQLDASLAHLIEVTHQNTRAHLASLPQFYSAKTLAERWSMSDEAVIAELRKRIGYAGARGHRVRVHIDDVLKVDEQLRGERQARIDAVRLGRIA